MKKQEIICKIIIYLCLFIGCPKIFSQTSKDSITQKVADTTVFKKPEKLKFGCGFGINFVGGTNINVSPNLTYIISDKIEVGGGLQGSYAAIKNLQNTTTFEANVLGR